MYGANPYRNKLDSTPTKERDAVRRGGGLIVERYTVQGSIPCLSIGGAGMRQGLLKCVVKKSMLLSTAAV